MKDKAWRLSPVLFAIAAICFLLPFSDIWEKHSNRADNKKIVSYTGYRIISGVTLPAGDGSQTKEKDSPENIGGFQPLAAITLGLALFGGIAGFARRRELAVVPAICAGSALVTQLMLKSKIDADFVSHSGGLYHAHYAYGFWLILFCLALSTVLNVWIFSGYEGEYSEDDWRRDDDFSVSSNTGTDEDW